MTRPHFIWILVASGSAVALECSRSACAQPELGTSLTLSQVRAILKAAPGHANFAGKRIINLDLGNLDFRGANFNRCNLFETTFHGANLSHASLVDAFLSATKFPNANLQRARLTGATLLTTAEGANFSGADLSRASGYLIAPQGLFVRANLSRARLRPDMTNQPMGLLHTILSQADLTDANLAGTDLTFASLTSAKFIRANLRGANFDQADLSRANFDGADVTDANFSKADISQTAFTNVRGRASMRGLELALNRDQAIFK
ncbi:MAG: pentapeptide repeat protein [Candidatus Eremiobacteraeota bacterium]|nr:pentapeptide repeat protein [Candidatus Eremiobacteraeota bacterium]